MKKITSILLLVAVFAMTFSLTAFAAEANTFTLTTDKAAVAAGETVTVTATISGDFLDVCQVVTRVKYDTTKFAIDLDAATYNDDYGDDILDCVDTDWFIDLNTNSAKKNNLGRISAPTIGENPAGQVNVAFQSSKGMTISNSNLASGVTESTSSLILKFTAVADVATIDATCFTLADNCLVQETDQSKHELTINQIVVEEEEFTPETIEGTEVAATATDIELEKDPATAYTNTYVGTAVFNAKLGADVKYGEAGFIWVKDGVKTANKFAVDASAINGGGTFDYGVAMYAIPAGVTITAIPYYVTAE